MDKIHIEIIQPSGKKLDSMIDSVIIPGSEGDFEVLPDHTPFITKIRPGTLFVQTDNKDFKFAIHDGFVTVENNHIIIITETIENDNEIDLDRAEAAKKRAESRLSSGSKDIDFRRASVALHRALARINTIS